jgi:hypothetical protein
MTKEGWVWGKVLGAIISVMLLLSSCGGGGGGTSSSTPTSTEAVTGTVTKGPLAGATITAFSISQNGGQGSQIGTTNTDGQGNFAMQMGNHTGPFMIQVIGGTFIDEGTGQQMTMGPTDRMAGAIPNISPGSTLSGIQITPVTSMAQSMAQNMAGGMTQANIEQANTAMGQYFDVSDVISVHPMDPTVSGSGASATQDQRNYGMTLAAMSQYAHDIGMPDSAGIVSAMMADASDGIMNGMMGGTQINMGGMGGMMGGSMMQPNAGSSGMGNAIISFIQSPNNKCGLTQQDMQVLINKLMASNGHIL